MSTIKRGEGNVVQIVAGGTYTSGIPELVGGVLFGVPQKDAVSGQYVGMEITGVQALPKTGGGGVTFAVGDRVYWNQASHKATATATDKLIGVCTKAAADADTEVHTRIVGVVIDAADADAIAAALGSGIGLALKTSATAVTTIKVNFAGTTAPGATDDTAAGYSIGSLWLDNTNKVVYQCQDASAGAAVWTQLSRKMLAGTATIPAAADHIDVSVGAAYDGKPVQVTIKGVTGGDGTFHATKNVTFKAVVASGTLTITALDAQAGSALTLASNAVLWYAIDGD